MTYYKTINGKRYDRTLLERADALTDGQGDGRISEADAHELFEAARDNRGIVTTAEVRTLRYILDTYPLTEKAHAWLWRQIRLQTPTQRAVQSILREIFGFEAMTWHVDDAAVEEYDSLYPGLTTFPVALREMIDEFLHGMESSTSVRDIVSLELGVDLDDRPAINAKVREVVGEGAIYLFPSDYLDRIRAGEIDFKYPPFTHRTSEYWPFGLRLPRLKGYYFIGFVNRQDWWDVYHTGYK